jgi:hypothetical protein
MVRFTSGDEGLPRWSKLRALQGPFTSGAQFGAARQTIEVATGWPWRALKSEFHDYPPGTSPPAGKPYATVSGIEMPVGVVKRGALFFVPRALPYRPILPGLIADVMLYGLMWWGLLTLLPSIRRWRRRRSGLCIACGYDLQGDQAGGCPECGWNRAELRAPLERQVTGRQPGGIGGDHAKKRTRPTLAAVVRFGLCAVLGVATTLAVAWALAAWLPHSSLKRRFNLVSSGSGKSLQYVSVYEYSRPGMVRREWIGGAIGAAGGGSALGELEQEATLKTGLKTSNQDRSWGSLPAALERGGKAAGAGVEDARGWPYLALWCTLDASAINGVGGGKAMPRWDRRVAH